MMNEQLKCIYEFEPGRKCENDRSSDAYCLLHSPDPNKDAEKFSEMYGKCGIGQDGIVRGVHFFATGHRLAGAGPYAQGIKYSGCHFHAEFSESGAIGSKPYVFDSGTTFYKEVILKELKTAGTLIFDGVVFKGQLTISSSIFSEKFTLKNSKCESTVEMTDSTFEKRMSIEGSEFSKGCEFAKLKFKEDLLFKNTEFKSELIVRDIDALRVEIDGSAIEDHTAFGLPVDFSGFNWMKEQAIIFRNVAVYNIRFLDSPVENMRFYGARWGRHNSVLADEKFIGENVRKFTEEGIKCEQLGLCHKNDIAGVYMSLAHLYRQFEYKYLEYLDSYRAGVFHRKEANYTHKAVRNSGGTLSMVFTGEGYTYSHGDPISAGNFCARLKYYGVSRGTSVLYWLYSALSAYGESSVRAGFATFIVLAIMPLFCLYGGVTIEGHPINYSCKLDVSQMSSVICDFFLILKYDLLTLLRLGKLDTLQPQYGRILIAQYVALPITLAFFIFAIRRRFKRKSM